MINKYLILYIREQVIQERVKELAEQISQDYADTPVTLIGVLNGSFIFMSDLVRNIHIETPIDISFVHASSYGNSTKSSGMVTTRTAPKMNLFGKDVLLIEDIVATGKTIATLRNTLSHYKPNSISVCSLIYRGSLNPTKLKQVPYRGFCIQDSGFLVGYGFDWKSQLRNLRDIYITSESPTIPEHTIPIELSGQLES